MMKQLLYTLRDTKRKSISSATAVIPHPPYSTNLCSNTRRLFPTTTSNVIKMRLRITTFCKN